MIDPIAAAAVAALKPSDRAHNLLVGPNVQIDPTAEIGANVVIYADVEIGPGAVVKQNAVVGDLPLLSVASRGERVSIAPTVLEAGAVVGTSAIVMSGAVIGENAYLGDFATAREQVVMHEGSMVGRAAALAIGTVLGARSRIQNATLTGIRTIIEEDVFVGANVTFTNTSTMRRSPAGMPRLETTVLRRACRVGSGVTLTPNLEIGEEAYVAAGAVVTKDVGRREKVRGVPARVFGMVTDEELLENWD